MKKLLFGLLAAPLLIGCEDVVDLDLGTYRRLLAVDGRVDNLFDVQRVKLTYSQPYLDQSAETPATGATVTIYDDLLNAYPMTETPAGSGIYEASFTGTEGRSYWVEIIIDGQTYTSNAELLKPVPPIDGLSFELADDDVAGEYWVLLTSQEPSSEGDYYQWRMFVDGEYRGKPENITVESDQFVNGNPIIDFDITKGDPIVAPANVLVWQMSLSQPAYRFWRTLQDQTAFVGSPFDPPPAPVIGNIANVANRQEYVLGYFQVSAIDTLSIQIP